jgi:hypothetical protein
MGSGGETMQTAQQLFQSAIDAATTSITALNDAVQAFTLLVSGPDGKLAGWATAIQTDMQTASAALQTAMDNFTLALGGDPSGGTTGTDGGAGGSGGGKTPINQLPLLANAADDGSTALGHFTAALNTATAAVNG